MVWSLVSSLGFPGQREWNSDTNSVVFPKLVPNHWTRYSNGSFLCQSSLKSSIWAILNSKLLSIFIGDRRGLTWLGMLLGGTGSICNIQKTGWIVLSCRTAIQAIKKTFFTLITRITSSRDKFGPPEISIRYLVMDSSILLEQQSSGCDHHYRNLIKIIQRIS